MQRSDRRSSAAVVSQAALVCPALIYALALAPIARADSVPASIRACSLESDSLKRLVCFDLEVARYWRPTLNGGCEARAPCRTT